MKKILSLLFSRVVFVAMFFLAQLIVIAFFVFMLSGFAWYYVISILLGIVMVVHIVNGNKNPAYKIGWIIPVLIFPIFGGMLYLMFGSHTFSKRKKQEMQMLHGTAPTEIMETRMEFGEDSLRDELPEDDNL